MYNNRLKALREEPVNFIRQKELADLIGVHVSVYSKYENKTANIPIEHLNTLCNHFDVSLDYIFEFTNKRKYENSREMIDTKLSSKRLKELRKELNLTQEKLSDTIKVQQTTISKYENNQRQLSTQYLYAICKEYKISADYLLGKIDKPKYYNKRFR